MGCRLASPFSRASLRRSTDFVSPGSGFRGRRQIRAPEGTGSPKMCGRTTEEECCGSGRCRRRRVPGLAQSEPIPQALAGSAFTSSPLLILYLDAAAQSWDLTFLRLRRPGNPRQGALRASAGRGRDDAKSSDTVLGEWVRVPSSKQQDQADRAIIS